MTSRTPDKPRAVRLRRKPSQPADKWLVRARYWCLRRQIVAILCRLVRIVSVVGQVARSLADDDRRDPVPGGEGYRSQAVAEPRKRELVITVPRRGTYVKRSPVSQARVVQRSPVAAIILASTAAATVER
jgi:hypothetical protein